MPINCYKYILYNILCNVLNYILNSYTFITNFKFLKTIKIKDDTKKVISLQPFYLNQTKILKIEFDSVSVRVLVYFGSERK